MRRKRTWKWLASTLFMLCMLFTLLPRTAMAATTITTVDVSGIDLPAPGATPDYNGSLPAGAPYHFASKQELADKGYGGGVEWINGIRWIRMDGFGCHDMPAYESFISGQVYWCDVVLIPNTGYTFANNVTCTINHDSELVDLNFTRSYGTHLYLKSVDWNDAAWPKITTVDVSGIDLPVAGETPDFDVTLPSGVNYHIATNKEISAAGWSVGDFTNGVAWKNVTDGSWMSPTDRFKAGKEYYFTTLLVPNTGYAFDSAMTVTLNGSTELVDQGFSSTIFNGNFRFGSVNWKAAVPITTVDVSGIDLPAAGEKPDFDVTLPSGVNYHIATDKEISAAGWSVGHYTNGVAWRNATDGSWMSPTDRFEAGKVYYFNTLLVPNYGYTFDSAMTVTLNGNTKLAYQGSSTIPNGNFRFASVNWKVEAPINTVDVSGITLPAAGEKPDFDVTLPSGVNYHIATDKEISAAGWSAGDYTNGVAWRNVTDSSWMSPTDRFEADKVYYFMTLLVPNTGYRFDSAMRVTLNGSTEFVDQDFSSTIANVNFRFASVNWKVAAPIKITTVDVSGIDLPVAGEKPDFDGLLPAGAPYHFASRQELVDHGYRIADNNINGIWWQVKNDSGYFCDMTSDETFVSGKQYRFQVVLIPNTGYTFASNVTGTINHDAGLVDSGNMENYITDLVLFSTDLTALEKITTVDVPGIDLPVAGEKPDFDVTLPSGVNYRIATDKEISAVGWSAGNYTNGVAWRNVTDSRWMSPTDRFEADKEYYFITLLVPNTGYTFDSAMTVTLNGSTELVDQGYSSTIFNGNFRFASVNWKAAAPVKIIRVDVSGIDLPVPGATPDFNGSLPEGAPYHFASKQELEDNGYDSDKYINGIRWAIVNDSGIDYMTSDEAFVSGKVNWFEVVLIPNTGYTFASYVTCTINHDSELISDEYSDGTDLWLMSIDLTAVDALIPITEVDVSGIDLPAAGETPDFNGILPEGAPYHFASRQELTDNGYRYVDKNINGILWAVMNDSGYDYITSDEAFVSGKEYWFEVVLIPNTGYTFADEVTCTLNHDSELIYYKNNYGTSLFLMSIALPCGSDTSDGLHQEADGRWILYWGGKPASDYTGLTLYNDTWYYVENGVLNWNYTGLTLYGDTWYYVENGALNWGYTGLTQYYGTWYYVENGALNWGYTGLTLLGETWYYVENGVLNWGYTGLAQYGGGWFYVENGVLNWGYTGLTLFYDTWYYVVNGSLNWDYTGLVEYQGGWYYVENSVLNWGYTGLVEYQGTWYYVENGSLNWGYTGMVLYYGTWYYIENGWLNWALQ